MARRAGGKGEDLPGKLELLRALGEARRAIITALTRVRPLGSTYHALSMVVTSMDALAYYLTGQPYYFADPLRTTPGPAPDGGALP